MVSWLANELPRWGGALSAVVRHPSQPVRDAGDATSDGGAVVPRIKVATATMPCRAEQCVAGAHIGKAKAWIDEGAPDN